MSDARKNVLVIDDEAELRFIVAVNLRAAGFEVIEANDALSGIALAAERQPDMIIMDIGLPGMDGIAATRALKADPLTASIPVVILTGRTSAADVVSGLEAGAQEYLAKPFDIAELLARVRTVQRLIDARADLDRLNSQLEAEVDVKTRRLQLLYEFMRDLNHADSREHILDLLVRGVEQTTGARRLSVFLLDESGENLVCKRAVGIDPTLVEDLHVAGNEGITGQVFRTGKTLAARTIGEDATDIRKYSSDSFLCTPLMSTSLETSDGALGVLNVTEKSSPGPFSDEEIGCIRSMADAAAIALSNVTRRIRLQQSVRVLLRTLGQLAEYRDEETTEHLERVTHMARILADEVRREGPYALLVNEEFIDSLVQAAPMHDIGKVGIPDDILTKPGKLTDEEYQIMKTHTDIGRRVLSQAADPRHPVPLLHMCIDIAYCHHERWDGRGYPRKLRGDKIPLAARIIAIVDAYDAITSLRRYKPSRSHEEAVATIRDESGKHFDPALVHAFLRCHEKFDEVRRRFNEQAANERSTAPSITNPS